MPDEFFTTSSILSLAGASGIVLVTVNAFTKVSSINPLKLAFFTSLFIAFLGVGYSELHLLENGGDIKLTQVFLEWMLAIFNGCLIFCTTLGMNEFASNQHKKVSIKTPQLSVNDNIGNETSNEILESIKTIERAKIAVDDFFKRTSHKREVPKKEEKSANLKDNEKLTDDVLPDEILTIKQKLKASNEKLDEPLDYQRNDDKRYKQRLDDQRYDYKHYQQRRDDQRYDDKRYKQRLDDQRYDDKHYQQRRDDQRYERSIDSKKDESYFTPPVKTRKTKNKPFFHTWIK